MTCMFKVFALGSNGSGQLGVGHQNDIATPELCQFDEEDSASITPEDRIAKIVAGGNHTLVLFESGAVFAAGSNEHRQCCLPPHVVQTSIFRRLFVHAATPTEELIDFVDVSATWEASFLLGRDGCVYVFGMGSKGELGLGLDVTATENINGAQLGVRGDNTPKFKQLYSGMRHTVAVGDEGEIYGWGSCRKSELGEEWAHRKVLWIPERLNMPFKCQKVVLGRNFTILFGARECKVFGEDPVLQQMVKQSDLLLKGDVGAGWSTLHILIDGQAKAFGRNDRGQWPSDELPGLSKLASGSEHCLGLTAEGEVVTWGWGEHGNCGQPTDSRGNVAGRWNVLPISLADDERIVSIAAGCATSFVISQRKP